jgi:hypothetical protein
MVKDVPGRLTQLMERQHAVIVPGDGALVVADPFSRALPQAVVVSSTISKKSRNPAEKPRWATRRSARDRRSTTRAVPLVPPSMRMALNVAGDS